MELFNTQEKKTLHRSGMWMVLTYLLTTVHHVYSSTLYAPDGSITGVFAGAWRAHGFLVFLIPLVLGLGALMAYVASRRVTWLHTYGFINATVFVALVGIWEGGWNHLAKLAFFALGAERFYAYGPTWLLQFPQVQPPTDLFFEATGVLTLAFGLLNARSLWRLLAVKNADRPVKTAAVC